MPLLINRTKGRVINTLLLSPVCKALPTFQFQSVLLPACKKLAGVYRAPGTRTDFYCSRLWSADPIITNTRFSLSPSQDEEVSGV